MKQSMQLIALLLILWLTGCGSGLTQAARDGDTRAIQKLLDGGADINESGTSNILAGPPLSFAAYYCRVEAVKYLIAQGAEVNPAVGFLGGGQGPLHQAAQKGCTEAVGLLLDAGADINKRASDSWGSALAFAAINGRIKTVKYFIERGADIDDAKEVLQRRGDKKALALLQTVEEPKIAAAPPLKSPVASIIKSDVDLPPAVKAAPQPDALAVIIGIETYQTLPKSEHSKNDAGMVKAYLAALGFQERNIELVIDERATKSAVEKAVEAWLPNRTTKDSTVFIYFSGHGAPEPATGESYMVPYDGDPNYLAVTGYPLKRLYERLSKLEAKEIIVVLDSCFSGSGGRSVLAKGTRPLVMMAATGALSANMAVLTATQGSQISTSSSDKGHGVFTYYFLKAIKEGKNNLAEIYETIKPLVEDESKQLNVQQSPSISPDVEKLRDRFSLRK